MAQTKNFIAPLDITERVLPGGRVITPGDPFPLSAEEQNDDHVRRMIDEGKIAEVKKRQTSETSN